VAEKILELKHISKSFPGVKALDEVHFDLMPGEIHGLMGENGAGKSTFIKIITGVHSHDTGEMFINGNLVSFANPMEAQEMGLAAIYQHVTCYPDLTVAENIYMGHEKIKRYSKRIDWNKMFSEAQELLEQLGANFDSHERMGNLSVARQQIVEIAKALSTRAKIIIMDEPTAALTQHESSELYRITEGLRDDGVSIIFISHRIEDIFRLADRVTVFRDSRFIGCWPMEEITQDKLIVAMVGREIIQMFPKRKVPIGEKVLSVENLTRIGYFRNVSLDLHKGEILALTGLVGAGRTEVCESIYGINPSDEGIITFDDHEIVIDSPVTALDAGIGFLPEDRQKQGLILDWEIGKNITLPSLSSFSRYNWLDEGGERLASGQLADKLNVKAGNIFTRASTLSGGNQQKVVVAKILTRNLKVIILDEPTKGVDIKAKTAIYEIIGDLVEQGYGIILISSEMPEVMGMSDRIVVMKEGHVTALLDTSKCTQEEILNAAMVVKTPRTDAAVSEAREG
jgi:rhamnose transport system ATP-binding protein